MKIRRVRCKMEQKQCIIYCRTSTNRQNIENQEGICRSFAKRKGLNVKAVFKDEGKSGTTMNGRCGLESALNTIEKGDFFLVRGIDRLARNIKDSQYIHERIFEKGGIFVSYEDSYRISNILPDIDNEGIKLTPAFIYLNYESKPLCETKSREYQINKCCEYAQKYNYSILNTFEDCDNDDEEIFDRCGFAKCLSSLKKDYIIIIPALQMLTTDIEELSDLYRKIKKNNNKAIFVCENLSTEPSELLMLKTMITIMQMQAFYSLDPDRKGHVLLMEKEQSDEIVPSEKEQKDGFLYIVKGVSYRKFDHAETIKEIHSQARIFGNNVTVELYRCKDPETKCSHFNTWLLAQQYIDIDNDEQIIYQNIDSNILTESLKSIIKSESICHTVRDLPKLFDEEE